jgi:tellurite resistance protein
MVFDLGRLAAALLTGGRGGRSAEARIVRAVTKAVAGAAGRSSRAGGAEAIRRKKEAEGWGMPAPPPARPRRRGADRAIAAGAAVLAETIAETMARSSAPPTLPPTIPAPREPARPPPAAPPPAVPAPMRRARSVPTTAPPAGGSSPSPAPSPPAAAPASEGLLLVRAMVAAAKADGRLDAAERKAILERLEIAGLSAAERDVVLADFDRPATPEALAKGVKDPLLAARIYAAAAAASGERCAAEREFLAALARALRLDSPAVEAIERQLGG